MGPGGFIPKPAFFPQHPLPCFKLYCLKRIFTFLKEKKKKNLLPVSFVWVVGGSFSSDFGLCVTITQTDGRGHPC